MRVDAFDFELPEGRVALTPAEPRETARLLRVPSDGDLEDRQIGDLPELLRPDDLLVLNDTRVIPAELTGVRRRETRHGSGEAEIRFNLHWRRDARSWQAFAKPAKRLATGDVVHFSGLLSADVVDVPGGGLVELMFNRSGDELDGAIAEVGSTPLPPYIRQKRAGREQDAADYQTIYARHAGAVAAPTAGLHVTDALLARFAKVGIQYVFVTLHVGAGTFLPVKSDDTSDHKMHAETGALSADVAEQLNVAREAGRRIVAFGTTSLRILETVADDAGRFRPWRGDTDIFITPGYRFRGTDALITNFHLPRSTLFMLVAAFSGLERIHAAYSHAIETGYRFYSFGDACLLDGLAGQ